MTYLKWKCRECGDIKVSNSNRTHQMDFCKCNKTGVDLEEGYMRVSGLAFEQLEEYDYNFFDELVICMIKQGTNGPISGAIFEMEGGLFIDLEKVWEIRELEDEIMESLK